MKTIPFAYSFELTLPTTVSLGTKVNFPDVPFLRDKKIFGIEANLTDVVVTCPSGASNLTSLQYSQSYLTIQSAQKSNQIVVQQPTVRFYPFYYGGIWLELQSQLWDFQKCYVEFVNTITAPANGQSMYFTVYYENPSKTLSPNKK